MPQFKVECGGSGVTLNGNPVNNLTQLWNEVPEMCKYAPPVFQFQAVKLNYTGASICFL